jgi:hypothetical protein
MNQQAQPDDRIRAWVRSGPEAASAGLVERTLGPVPRMRQRRSWRIVMDRWTRPLAGVAAGAAALGVVVIGLAVMVGMPGRGSVGDPGSTPVAGLRPTFELVLDGTTYRSDPDASVATCLGDDDGSWSVLYAGGEPFLSLDLVVGAGGGGPGREDAVGAEIQTTGQYVRFDPAVLRGGDPPGRSGATVVMSDDGPSTTFVVTATTPQRITGEDGPSVEVALTLTCAPSSTEVMP